MKAKSVITLALVLGFAQSAFSGLDVSQTNLPGLRGETHKTEFCPNKSTVSLFAKSAAQKDVQNYRSSGGNSGNKDVVN